MIASICPYMNASEPLCCNEDQVSIMTENYQQIDSVFGMDCPLCAVNLKKLWCEYTCNPKKNEFDKGLGYADNHGVKMTEVFFSVNETMACDLFQSCKKVSLIAQASLQSSISFLDFMVSCPLPLLTVTLFFPGRERAELVAVNHHLRVQHDSSQRDNCRASADLGD